MNSMKHKHIRNILLLCLCAALLCGAAAAEEPAPVSALDTGLRYMDTLPDGRILLGGFRNVPETGKTAARLLCMNSDGTVSWDYVDTANRNAGFTHASVLPDGTIGVVLEKNLLSGREADQLLFIAREQNSAIAYEIHV